MSFSLEEAKERIPSQREKIVNKLKEAGEKGVTNKELNNISLKYCARISELHSQGYVIDCKHVKNGLYKYILRKIPSEIRQFSNATDEILQIVEHQFQGLISTSQLRNLLIMKHFHITRKSNWFKQHIKSK